MTFLARSADIERRKAWPSGIEKISSDRLNAQFWANATVEEKFEALRLMVDDFWTMTGHESTSRLQRHLGGIRKL